jgi:hypothetical protein
MHLREYHTLQPSIQEFTPFQEVHDLREGFNQSLENYSICVSLHTPQIPLTAPSLSIFM